MHPSAQEVLKAVSRYLEAQPCSGTLQSLQRAVLAKGMRSLEKDGHWPILDFPLSISRAIGGGPLIATGVGGSCALFYAFADVTDDAQDHDLSPDPWGEWGWEQAINTGTSLLFSCLQHLYDQLPQPLSGRVAEVFVRAGLEMTDGQHFDLIGQAAKSPTVQGYFLAAERKSGASFGAYAQAMALASLGESTKVELFREFGRSLGMVFQMLNDTYELWSPRLSSDFANRRLSLPIVLGIEQLKGSARERLFTLLDGPSVLDRQLELVSLLEEGGVRGYAALRIEVYRRRARQLAERLEIEADPYLAKLLEIPAFPQENVAI